MISNILEILKHFGIINALLYVCIDIIWIHEKLCALVSDEFNLVVRLQSFVANINVYLIITNNNIVQLLLLLLLSLLQNQQCFRDIQF